MPWHIIDAGSLLRLSVLAPASQAQSMSFSLQAVMHSELVDRSWKLCNQRMAPCIPAYNNHAGTPQQPA